ncbi:TPA: hypothetical protein DCZ39_07705 [Patescibacteria group bacterium]|nr:hypothetical protein [Candidatus Gracilibacteria bacterium]
MYVFKIVTFVTLGLLSMLGMISFAADPSFSITPSSLTGKLHCGYTFGMILNPAGINYNGFSSTIKFDSGNVSLRGMTFNPIFAGPHTSYITD